MKIKTVLTIARLIKEIYWKVWPYDWRPSQIWYWIKCYFIKYSTVKPRYLPHTYCDKVELLPHMMFEILSQFIEKECTPPNDRVDWKATNHKITVNRKKINIRDEMQALYDWWHNTYIKEYPKKLDELWEETHKYSDGFDFKPFKYDREEVKKEDADFFVLENKYKNVPDAEEKYKQCLKDIHNFEIAVQKELIKNMTRLVRLTPYLWT